MGSTWAVGFWFGWFIWLLGVWLFGCKEQDRRVWVVQDF